MKKDTPPQEREERSQRDESGRITRPEGLYLRHGRTRIDLIRLANEVEQALSDCQKPITVAVMGCVVNGPGEAREADVGIAGGDGCGILFVRGKQLKKLSYDELLPALLEYIEQL